MSSTRLPFLRSTVIALALAGGPALAQDTAPASKAPAETEPATPALPEMPRLDIGTSTGLNNPAGMYGIETDFRLLDRVSVGILGGNGAWGIRLTPQARLYPFGVSRAGLFLEAGMSLNFGGMTYLESGDYRQEADMLFTPAANGALGYRISFLNNRAWTLVRVGYSVNLKKDNYAVRGGGELNPLLGAALKLSEPGGLVLGASAGISLF